MKEKDNKEWQTFIYMQNVSVLVKQICFIEKKADE